MASRKYYNSILFMIIVVYFSLFSFCYASQIKSRTHHTLDLSQHGQLSHCIDSAITTTTTTGKDRATAVLEVFHKQRLCADEADGATSLSSSAENILRGDQLRVKHLRQKMTADRSDDLPVESGYNLYSDNYIVLVGFGTPARKLHLVFDTGSDLTWTQCQPCIPHCYKQRDRTFDPRNSTTYSNISCTDRECPQSMFDCDNTSRRCLYDIVYGDDSYTNGFMAKDKLTLTKNDVFPNFMFGCSHNSSGLFGETAGILGLSRGRLSFVSQTAQKYFSYFLPPNPNSSGRLTFGRNINNTKKDVKFTPLIDVPQGSNLYFIKITSISVGGTRLPIPSSVFKSDKNIIDSGTVITWLPKTAYITMRDEFKCQMNTTRFPIAPAFEILDTCFSYPIGKSIEFPSISFKFEGNVTVELDASGVFYVVDLGVVCLAFAAMRDDFSIFGNIQQRNMEVVYDITGKKLGFGVHAG